MEEIKVGDYVRTPRFLNVRISAVFENVDDAVQAGFTEPTHYEHMNPGSSYRVYGKSLDMYRMRFCACKVGDSWK